LPRPPRSSCFYDEWYRDGGEKQDQEKNIYRQKFDAYYGRSVSGREGGSNFIVKTETLFPVFLATIVLATCWTVVLWDLKFTQHPGPIWDILKFGFLGAYGFITQTLLRRFFQSDLRPSAYAHALLRIIIVFTVLVTVYQIIDHLDPGVQAVIAFVVGAFPIVGISALHGLTARVLHVAVPHLDPKYPLRQITGLNVWYEFRLLEEGIEDMQSLLTSNIVDIVLHTRVPVGRLVDWIDQALLYIHLNPVRDKEKWTSNCTETRLQLQHVGIRSATDLLRAFPEAQINADDVPHCIDCKQIRILVRTLRESDALAPIWNWQERGIRRASDSSSRSASRSS
jgi:hypothetical protein